MKVLTHGIRLLLHVATQCLGGAELADLVSTYYADPTKSLRNAVEKANADALLAVDLALRPDWIARRSGAAPATEVRDRAAWPGRRMSWQRHPASPTTGSAGTVPARGGVRRWQRLTV